MCGFAMPDYADNIKGDATKLLWLSEPPFCGYLCQGADGEAIMVKSPSDKPLGYTCTNTDAPDRSVEVVLSPSVTLVADPMVICNGFCDYGAFELSVKIVFDGSLPMLWGKFNDFCQEEVSCGGYFYGIMYQ